MTEALVVTTLGALVVGAMLPSLADSLRRARFDAAVRGIVTDIREARSQAITTGWEYRLIGRRGANQYRTMGRASSAVAWPALGVEPFRSETQYAGKWVNLDDEYDGVQVNSSRWRFSVDFDARGAARQRNFSPLGLTNNHDKKASISISAVGGINVE